MVSKKIYILSIAGSDSSSGAGIQADLKTVMLLGGYWYCFYITSITAQNKNKVSKIYNLNSDLVIDQIKSIMEDFDINGIKIGLVNNKELSKKFQII